MLCFLCLTISVQAEEQKDEIRKTLRFTGSDQEKWLELDNINGSIEVTGYNGSEVQLVVSRTIWGRNRERIQLAKEEVVLEIREDGNTITLFVDAPYRQPDGSINYRGRRRYGYEVTMDFKLKVPEGTSLTLKTINNGEIIVENVRGDFEVNNINGGIRMSGLVGSGKVYALNGEVDVQYAKNPAGDCYFGSLNGDVEVALLSGLSADLQFKTFNGKVYTDFDFASLPAKIQTSKKRRKGKFVYKTNEYFGVRVAQGGPELQFDAFNGSIYVKETR
ncbi:MAG: DUF4097 domain-containing protein [bacterium]